MKTSALALFISLALCAFSGAADRPNFVFIIADDQSPFDLKMYNRDSILDTPVLDELASKGMVFDGAYQFVAVLSETNLGGGALQKPTSLDVDASGDLYVYDDKEKTIVRLH